MDTKDNEKMCYLAICKGCDAVVGICVDDSCEGGRMSVGFIGDALSENCRIERVTSKESPGRFGSDDCSCDDDDGQLVLDFGSLEDRPELDIKQVVIDQFSRLKKQARNYGVKEAKSSYLVVGEESVVPQWPFPNVQFKQEGDEDAR